MNTIAQLISGYAFFGYTKAEAVKRIVATNLAKKNLRETSGSLAGKELAVLMGRKICA